MVGKALVQSCSSYLFETTRVQVAGVTCDEGAGLELQTAEVLGQTLQVGVVDGTEEVGVVLGGEEVEERRVSRRNPAA